MIQHHGGACPCHPEALVTVQYANGYCSGNPLRAAGLRWSRRDDPWDIAAYFVLDVPEEHRA
jgi:hypothetical protein